MNQSEELRMTYSGIITKKGQKIVHVFFERGNLLDSRQQS